MKAPYTEQFLAPSLLEQDQAPCGMGMSGNLNRRLCNLKGPYTAQFLAPFWSRIKLSTRIGTSGNLNRRLCNLRVAYTTQFLSLWSRIFRVSSLGQWRIRQSKPSILMQGKALLLVPSALRLNGGGPGPGRKALPCELRVQPEVQVRRL